MKWLVAVLCVFVLALLSYIGISQMKYSSGADMSSVATSTPNPLGNLNKGPKAQSESKAIKAVPQTQTRKEGYDSCVAAAQTNYDNAWTGACASQYARANQQYPTCYQQYGDLQDYCNQLYPGRFDGSAKCSLYGTGTAPSLNAALTADKDRCATLWK